jgi:hypothetical protein
MTPPTVFELQQFFPGVPAMRIAPRNQSKPFERMCQSATVRHAARIADLLCIEIREVEAWA